MAPGALFRYWDAFSGLPLECLDTLCDTLKGVEAEWKGKWRPVRLRESYPQDAASSSPLSRAERIYDRGHCSGFSEVIQDALQLAGHPVQFFLTDGA
jgi:hypothetical protein